MTMNIRLTKEFHFEMAHALFEHDGPCKNIHGHSYKLSVTIIGNPINDTNSPKLGMVADFADLKKIVGETVIQLLDHALVLNQSTNSSITNGLKNQKLILVDFQPTCENMLIFIAKKLKTALPLDFTLHHLLLRETASSYAEWYAEDNK
jgi:6-pyruvoyltetrahydropterin/6-carboxytetrahydropterin synthase